MGWAVSRTRIHSQPQNAVPQYFGGVLRRNYDVEINYIDFCINSAMMVERPQHMTRKSRQCIEYRLLELDGVRYAVIRESVFEHLCQQARMNWQESNVNTDGSKSALDLDGPSLAEKLKRRRLASRLSQAELARRASIRPETLNRIERGRTTPDFATIRKLVIAMNTADRDQLVQTISKPGHKEHQ